jgi:uncharacterized phage protein (TIGR01671 family)
MKTKRRTKKVREILFRGKQSNSDAWVNGIYCPYTWDFFGTRVETPQIIIISNDNDDGKWTDVIPETVGQYTGLTDKNGEKIFEGDIVRVLDHQKGIVTFECGAFGIGIMPYIDWDYFDSEIAPTTGCNNSPMFCYNDNYVSLWELMWNYNQEDNWCEIVEIIGNIHDNPDLLDSIN